jgi:hypothetical protein
MPMAAKRKSDPLAAPEGGWSERAVLARKERMGVAKWIWSIPPGDDATRYSIESVHTVERGLYSLAATLLDDLRNRDSLPTKREHVNRLNDISRTARRLQSQIQYISGAHNILRLVAVQSAFFRYQNHLMIKNREPQLVDFDEVLAVPLAILVQLATEQAADIATAAPGAGHQRLHDRLFGDPRSSLAIRAAATVAELCGSAAVKSTDGGVVHRVMNLAWMDGYGSRPRGLQSSRISQEGHPFVARGRVPTAEPSSSDGSQPTEDSSIADLTGSGALVHGGFVPKLPERSRKK